MAKVHLFILLFMFACVVAVSQPISNPKVGEKCPDFTLSNLHHPATAKASLADFRGKWLILDFWNKACVLCPRSFPKLSRLQQVFQDSIQILLIGINSNPFNTGIEEFYENLRLKNNLKLTIAYDSVAKEVFRVRSVPHVVVIDPSGIIRAITLPDELDEINLRLMLSGKKHAIRQKTD